MTYTFNINAISHPFWIKTTQTTGQEDAYNTGIQNNGAGFGVGTLIFAVPADAELSILYYNCEFHSSMAGVINIIG
jgi:hypothetical protein